MVIDIGFRYDSRTNCKTGFLLAWSSCGDLLLTSPPQHDLQAVAAAWRFHMP